MNNPPPGKIKLDWVSFTVKLPAKPGQHLEFQHDITEAMRYRFPMLPDMTGAVAQGVGKRQPYTRMIERSGVVILFNPSIPHALIEITGQGCTAIGNESLITLLENVLERLTRLDVALDIETPITPAQIVSEGYSERFKGVNYWHEESGESYYVGSKKSDRYVRVYRWHEPHPRAHLLRFEYVTRRETAKATARHAIEHGLEHTLGSLSHVFSWQHPAASQYDTGQRIKAWSEPHKKSVGTMRWVVKAVFPALERLQSEGALTPDFWRNFAERFPQSQVSDNNNQPTTNPL
jgi:hypothetical protein